MSDPFACFWTFEAQDDLKPDDFLCYDLAGLKIETTPTPCFPWFTDDSQFGLDSGFFVEAMTLDSAPPLSSPDLASEASVTESEMSSEAELEGVTVNPEDKDCDYAPSTPAKRVVRSQRAKRTAQPLKGVVKKKTPKRTITKRKMAETKLPKTPQKNSTYSLLQLFLYSQKLSRLPVAAQRLTSLWWEEPILSASVNANWFFLKNQGSAVPAVENKFSLSFFL